MKTVKEHYSYAAYADPGMAASFDAKRFGGPIGQLLLEDQERILVEFLGDVSQQRILDLGAGTGRAAPSSGDHSTSRVDGPWRGSKKQGARRSGGLRPSRSAWAALMCQRPSSSAVVTPSSWRG